MVIDCWSLSNHTLSLATLPRFFDSPYQGQPWSALSLCSIRCSGRARPMPQAAGISTIAYAQNSVAVSGACVRDCAVPDGSARAAPPEGIGSLRPYRILHGPLSTDTPLCGTGGPANHAAALKRTLTR